MNKEIENLIRKTMAKDIEIEMLDLELKEKSITRESMLEILKKLTD